MKLRIHTGPRAAIGTRNAHGLPGTGSGVNHQQVLDKLAARGHVRALDEELARWVHWQMLAPPATHEELTRQVISPVLTR